MRKAARRLTIGLGGITFLLFVIIFGFSLFFNANYYKPQIEAAIAQATGMDLKIKGEISLKIFPHIQLSLTEVALSNRGKELFSAEDVQVAPRLIPFIMHREIVLNQLSVSHPKIKVEKDKQGHMNYEPRKKKVERVSNQNQNVSKQKGTEISPGEIKALKIHDGELAFIDHTSGKQTKISGMSINLHDISWSEISNKPRESSEIVKMLSFKGDWHVNSLSMGSLLAHDLKADIRSDRGVIRLDKTEAKIFGGLVRGTGEIDLNGSIPKVKMNQNASEIDLSQALPSKNGNISGVADGSINLTATGKDDRSMIRTSDGSVSIRGHDITVKGVNVDELASKLKAAQGLDLVSLGSALISGPLGSLMNQASGIPNKATNAKSVIRDLVSTWDVQNGIAQAKDVAFRTEKTTIAFRGRLNLVSQTYQGFQVASVDPKGCVKDKVEVAGAFTKPHPTLSSIAENIPSSALDSVGEGIGSMGSQLAGVLGDNSNPAPEKKIQEGKSKAGCEPFYSGSVLDMH